MSAKKKEDECIHLTMKELIDERLAKDSLSYKCENCGSEDWAYGDYNVAENRTRHCSNCCIFDPYKGTFNRLLHS